MIGLFDSGVGGLGVWREIVALVPGHDTIYVADQAHVPYGSRPLKEVRAFAEAISRFLLAQGAEVIVVACNTASAAALRHLRDVFPDTPLVGMEPAVKPAAQNTRTGAVGVIATPATFQGQLFASLVERFAADVRVLTQTCPGLVEAVEAGALNTPETERLVRACLQPLLDAGVDELVLGCTHYPFVRPLISKIVGAGVEIIDPAPAVAQQVQRVLVGRGLDAPSGGVGRHAIFTSGDPAAFAGTAERLVGWRGGVGRLAWQEGRLVVS